GYPPRLRRDRDGRTPITLVSMICKKKNTRCLLDERTRTKDYEGLLTISARGARGRAKRAGPLRARRCKKPSARGARGRAKRAGHCARGAANKPPRAQRAAERSERGIVRAA